MFLPRPMIAAAGLFLLLLIALPLTHAEAKPEKQTCQTAAQCLKPVEGDFGARPLLTADLLLFAALMAERNSLDHALRAFEKSQQEVLNEGLAAIRELYKTWKLDDVSLRGVLIELMMDLAVLHRFFSPEDEFLLSFEKSVQIRMSTFYRLLASGSKGSHRALIGGPGNLSSLDMARLYTGIYPFEIDNPKGRLKALIWISALRSHPGLKTAWMRMKKQSALLYSNEMPIWSAIEKAATTLPLARLEDLIDPELDVRFKGHLARNNTNPGEVIERSAAAMLLPAPQTAFSHAAAKLLEAGFQPGTASLITLARGTSSPDGEDPLSREDESIYQSARETFDKFLDRHTVEALLFDRSKVQDHLISETLSLGLWSQFSPGQSGRPFWNSETAKFAIADMSVELKPKLYEFLAWRFAARSERLGQSSLTKKGAAACRRWAGHFSRLTELGSLHILSSVDMGEVPPSLAAEKDLQRALISIPAGRRVIGLGTAGADARSRLLIGGAHWLLQFIDTVIPGDEEKEQGMDEPAIVGIPLRFKALRLVFGVSLAVPEYGRRMTLPETNLSHPALLALPPAEIGIGE